MMAEKKFWFCNTLSLCSPFVSNNTTSEVHIHGSSQPNLLFTLSYIIQPFGNLQGCDSVLQKGSQGYQLFVNVIKEINVIYPDVVRNSKMVEVPPYIN
jgi:hypothetical protein